MRTCQNCIWQDDCYLTTYYGIYENNCDDFYSIFKKDNYLTMEEEYKEYLKDMQKHVYSRDNTVQKVVNTYGKISFKV